MGKERQPLDSKVPGRFFLVSDSGIRTGGGVYSEHQR